MANFTPLTKRLVVAKATANLDYLYGPWSSKEEAYSMVPTNFRHIGRTVGIIENGSVVEYWWKSGIEDTDLKKKSESMILSLQLIGDSSFDKEEGEAATAQFLVDGGSGVKKAVLYQIVNDNEVFVQEYTNIGKGSPYPFTIPIPSVSGVFTYHIKVLDALDNFAVTEEGLNYIEYTLRYGGLSTIYNLTQLDAISIKNYETVADKYFQLSIYVRDNTFNVTGVSLTDSTDPNSTGFNVSLTPYNDISKTQESDTYTGNKYYFMPNSQTLQQISGKECSIVISYTENGVSKQKTNELFRLLDVSTLDILPEHEGDDYYTSLPAYYTFQLLSGVSNLSVLLTADIDSDFYFEDTTVISYSRYSLRIIPRGVKNNAKLIINYQYTYNSQTYTGSFTRTIGNILPMPQQSYYEPAAGSSVTLEKLIDANEYDHTGIDGTQYYKTISEDVSTNILSTSFILDTYCKINQQNDKTINYITISYGGVEVATVNEDEITCAKSWAGLYTDTPLNEWTQIGIGINLQEDNPHNPEGDKGNYHAIYINGMVVKTVRIGDGALPLSYDAGKQLVVTVGNGILVQKCFIYYSNTPSFNIILPSTPQGIPIIYNNYKSHKVNFEEPQDLPVLRFLRISNSAEYEEYFRLINEYKAQYDEDELKHLTQFGTIGSKKATSMGEYDPNYASSTIESNATLFRQHVDIKKPAQKEYAVLCKVMWQGTEIHDVIVECHTQGTSTLVYAVPNFKFTFWLVGNNTIERYYPQFIQKDGSEYYRESIYTAKADFMDSSHLNNTPTCIFYNNLIQNLIDVNKITGSPSARNGMLDAILGFPIVMEISDSASSFGDTFTNIGSFMLNIDKTGDSLGFEVDDPDTPSTHLSCISFEGTSNDNKSGAAGRFDIPDGITLKDYTVEGEVDEAEIRDDYAVAYNAKGMNLTDLVDGVMVKDLPYVKWCSFLSDGLEYRYPDSDIYKEKSGKLNKIMDIEHFIALYKMWWWVYTSDTLSKEEYQEGFVEHFDFHYCAIYFINMMTYGQTDNPGKNAMFDSWDWKHWFPRPYDLDSEAGLDNHGNDNVAPFVEICAEFSLNYDISKANDWPWREQNYLIDEDTTVDEHLYKASTIRYGSQTYDRYHYSSNKSKLWINFYKNFKEEIENFYIDLRNNFSYTPENIIGLCEDILIDKLGVAQYNQDFKNKYLATKDQRLAYGNRWYKFKKWITKRFAFCDSYFGASESATYDLTSTINYNIKVDAPQYIAQQYQGESNRETKFVLDETSFNAGSGAATKITLLVNQHSVLETSLFRSVTLSSGSTDYSNLISLDVSGNNHSAFTNITSLTGTNLDNLKYLNISNSSVQVLSVPPNVKKLVAENVGLNSLTFPEGCAIEEISLKGSTLSSAVNFSSLPNLKKLDITDCTFNQGITFAYVPELTTLIMTRAIFRDDITVGEDVNVTTFDFTGLTLKGISFSGSNLNVETINFHNATFTNTTLNLNAVASKVKYLYFDNCSGLKHLEITNSGTFNSLICLSLASSSIKTFGSVNTAFDCVHLVNMGSLKKVLRYDTTITYTGFNFYNTKIEKITNINWSGSGASLFRDCSSLISIQGTMTMTNSMDYMFYRCYALTTLPTINVGNSVTTAQYLFAGANNLSYNSVANVIAACKHVTNFSHALRCKQFAPNQVIALDTLFANNSVVTTLEQMFSQYAGSTYRAVSNSITVTGTIPATAINAKGMFWGLTISVPYNIISDSSVLTNVDTMFAGCAITFTGEGRPIVQDSHGETVTLTNSVSKNFFCSSLIYVSRMFYGSNVITTDSELFSTLPNLQYAMSTFASGSAKQFSFINSANETEGYPLNVANLWNNNPELISIAGCFANIYNVYCSDLNFHGDVTSDKTVDISGLFGLTSNTYRSAYPITINIDSIVPALITSNSYPSPIYSTVPNGVGVFQNRSVIINSSSSTSIFAKLTSGCRNMFNGAILYLPAAATTFNLTNVIDCTSMFQGCRLYKHTAGEHTYTVNDRKFVDVILPSNCNTYTRMFQDSSVLLNLPSINSASASDLNYMYQGCIINDSNLVLPADYFEICATNLTTTAYMFCNNQYIVELEYDEDRGLFEDCVKLANVEYMFSGAIFLHKGIPVNLFGSTPLPKIVSLAYMFGTTSILYDVADGSHKWINASTLSPLTGLDNISGMFYRVKMNHNEYTSTHGTLTNTVKDVDGTTSVDVIGAETFTGKTYANISKLFEHAVYNPAGTVRFKGFSNGQDAFFSSSVAKINDPFVDSLYVSSIVNANRMFYQSPTGGRRNQNITNLSTFVNALISYPNITKYNIAGNIDDNTIPDVYKGSTTEAESIVYSGFNLMQETTPENYWTNYKRYNSYPRS